MGKRKNKQGTSTIHDTTHQPEQKRRKKRLGPFCIVNFGDVGYVSFVHKGTLYPFDEKIEEHCVSMDKNNWHTSVNEVMPSIAVQNVWVLSKEVFNKVRPFFWYMDRINPNTHAPSVMVVSIVTSLF